MAVLLPGNLRQTAVCFLIYAARSGKARSGRGVRGKRRNPVKASTVAGGRVVLFLIVVRRRGRSGAGGQLGVLIIGLDDDKHVYNVSVEDSRFNNVEKGGNQIKGAKDITFKNLYINGELVK